MGGRNFVQFTRPDPAVVVRLLEDRPACFPAAEWRLLLLDIYRHKRDDQADRDRLLRGEVPDYCVGCTHGYRDRMEAAGKCRPFNGSTEAAHAAAT